jgi:hypothetical protein
MATTFCATCGTPFQGFPFCGICGSRNPDFDQAPSAPVELDAAQSAVVALLTADAEAVGADEFLLDVATAKALGRQPHPVALARAVQSFNRLQRLLVEVRALPTDEQELARTLLERLERRSAWANDVLGADAVTLTRTPAATGGSAPTLSTTRHAPVLPSKSVAHIDGAQVLAGAGVILLVAATLLFEQGKHSWMIVAPALGLMAILGALTAWCQRSKKLAPAGAIFRTATALVLPLVIENIIAAMHWQSATTNRNLTIGIGALTCTVVYGGLARSLRSSGFLVLSYAAAATGWIAVAALVPLHGWRAVSYAALSVPFLAVSRVDWWAPKNQGEASAEPQTFSVSASAGLLFHAAAVVASLTAGLRYAQGGHYLYSPPIVLTVLALLTGTYLAFAWRATAQWAAATGLVTASLGAFVASTWLINSHNGVVAGTGAAAVTALAVVGALRPTFGSFTLFPLLLATPLAIASLSVSTVQYPSWTGPTTLAATATVALMVTRLGQSINAVLTRVSVVAAEFIAADAVFFALWGGLHQMHHAGMMLTAPVAMIAAGVVSVLWLGRAWWTMSRYEVLGVHPAYAPALLATLITLGSSVGYLHLSSSMPRALLVAGIMTAYAGAVWYSAIRVRLIWLVFASAALLSWAQATLLQAHGAIVWLPGSSLAAIIFAAVVFYVSKRVAEPSLRYIVWGLVLFVFGPLLRSEYLAYSLTPQVSTAYAVVAVSLAYASLVWYAAHRLNYRWAVFFSGALVSEGLVTLLHAYASAPWVSPTVVLLVMALTSLYVAYIERWLGLVLVAAGLVTAAVATVLVHTVGTPWTPLSTLATAVLFYGVGTLRSFTVETGEWLPEWLDGSGRYSFGSWRNAVSATQILSLYGGLLWSGLVLHHDGTKGALISVFFIVVTAAPRLRPPRAEWTLLDAVVLPMSVSGCAPVLAVLAHQHNLQYFNLVPASTLFALSVTLIDRELGDARARVLDAARLLTVLALTILFGTTLSQAFGSTSSPKSVYLLWLMAESVIVLLVGVRTRTRVSTLVGSAAVISSVLLTLARSGGQVGGYLTAVALAIVLLFVALSQIAKRGEGTIGERTREVWSQWR